MSRIPVRGWIALAAVVVALLWSRPANAQVGIDPGPPREQFGLVNNVVIGAQYDIVNQKLAERRLFILQEKLRRDSERGDVAAVDRGVHRIDNVKYRIAMDEWLIRWNLREYPCFYTIRTDPVSCAAIAQATHPIPSPYPSQVLPSSGPMLGLPTQSLYPSQLPPTPTPTPTPTPGPNAAAATIPITIVNAEPAGAGIAFAIDGVAYQAAAGSRQNLAVAPGSNITFDGGGSVGQRQYLVTPGGYEFRSTAEGWAFYQVSAMP